MPDPDDGLRYRIQRAARSVPTTDVMAAIERRRRRRDATRRTVAAVLSIALVAVFVSGVALARRSSTPAAGADDGLIAFVRTLRSCYEYPGVGGPQTDVFASTVDGTTQWDLTDGGMWSARRVMGETHPTFSPDGTRFAWVDMYLGRLAVTDVRTGDTTVLVKDLAVSSPIWSPEGDSIVFAGGDPDPAVGGSHLYTVSVTGGIPVELTSGSASDMTPTWSPDRGTIAFVRTPEGSAVQELWFMAPDGTDQRRMLEGRKDVSVVSGEWSPDGTRFVAEAVVDGNHDIYVADIDSRTGARLTDDPADDIAPTWSPDGSTIAFSTGRWGTGVGHSEIAVIDADGSNLRRVTDDCWDDTDPTWVANDGAIRSLDPWSPAEPVLGNTGVAVPTDILYATAVDGNEDLFALDPDGGSPVNLTGDLMPEGEPAWSPDRTRIIFSGYGRSDEETGLYVMNADGSDRSLIVPGGSGAAWSPDGTRIAYTENGNLMTAATDGSDIAQVTTSGQDGSPTWSPDGTRIAFIRNSSLFVVDADGSDPQRVTDSGQDYEPDWSPTGDLIVFTGARDVFLVHADGSGLRNLTPGGYPMHTTGAPRGRRTAPASCSPATELGRDRWACT